MLVGIDWKPLPWNTRYEVSNEGDVRKLINRTHCNGHRPQIRMIKLGQDQSGYVKVTLSGKSYRVHRLVYATFNGPLVDGLVVCHVDGNRNNNTPANLIQATQAENIAHKIQHGTAQAGEKHGASVYSDDLVRKVKAEILTAPRSPSGRLRRGAGVKIAEKFGVGRELIHGISQDRAWRHI